MSTTLSNRNSSASGVPSSGNLSATDRFTTSNLPVPLLQQFQGGMNVLSSYHSLSNNMNGVNIHSAIPGMPSISPSPIMGVSGPRFTSSEGNIAGTSVSRAINVGPFPTLIGSHLNFGLSNGNNGVGGPGRPLNALLQQGQALSGNGQLSSMALARSHGNEGLAFDLSDFPQLPSQPNSAGSSRGSLATSQKQAINSIVQQSQEFSKQNEDFPALPGFKGSGFELPVGIHQKEQQHESALALMQSQHFTAPSPVSDLFHGALLAPYHAQVQSPTQMVLQSLRKSGFSSISSASSSYEQLLYQYQHPQQLPATISSHHQQLPPGIQTVTEPYGLLGLLGVIRMTNPHLTTLALGTDLTTLGLNLNSRENLYKTFASPWAEGLIKEETEFTLPQCYAQPDTRLQPGYLSKFQENTLFTIFYSMPNDEAQLYAANELCNRGWFYHKELRMWLTQAPNMEPLVKTNSYERGSYFFFNHNKWEFGRKDNFVLNYEMVEKRPQLPLLNA